MARGARAGRRQRDLGWSAPGSGRTPFARAHDRVLRVARTVADLEGSAALGAAHVVEAIGYRSLDRKLWMR